MTIVSPARNPRAFLVAVAALSACVVPPTRQLAPAAPVDGPAKEPNITAAAREPRADPDGLDEAQARSLLAARFRAAGLRIRYDVALEGPGFSFTADGYDPGRGVGYEYIAFAEVDTDVTPDEAAALEVTDSPRVLVVWAAGPAAVDAAARVFLAGLSD